MPRSTKAASAPKFAVISDLPGCTVYTGTREQLVALGVANAAQFPEGKKRLKWDYSMTNSIEEGWAIRKIKGGLFKLNKSHALRFPQPAVGLETLLLYHNPGAESGYSWAVTGGICSLIDDQPPREITEAIEAILSTAQDMQNETRRSRLSVVKPATAVGGAQ